MDLHVTLTGKRDLAGQIYRQMREAILSGRLRSGDKLPPTRYLAEAIVVSRKTVTEAYDLLMSEGFLVGRVGDGTYVADAVPAARAAKQAKAELSPLAPLAHWQRVKVSLHLAPTQLPYEFRIGLPDVTWFPFAVFRRLSAQQLYELGKSPPLYGSPQGYEPLREAIAKHVAFARSVVCSADSVVVTNGAQHAFELLARILVKPGTVVAVEDPGYPLARACFESHGAKVVGVPLDAEGLVVQRLPATARLVYITPSHQLPLGMPMSLGRRLELLAWAKAHRALIVEDDYDSEFRFEGRPLESLQNLDRDGVVAYVGTFSKTMFPALRLGFVVAPGALHETLVKAQWLGYWHSNALAQATLARFIQAGHLAKHIRKMRRVYAGRRRVLLERIHNDFDDWFEPIVGAAGIHLAVWLKQDIDVDALVASARTVGVGLHPSARFATRPQRKQGLVFGFGAIEEGAITAGLGRLKHLMEREYPVRSRARSRALQ